MGEVKMAVLTLNDERELIEASQRNPKEFKPLYEAYYNDVFRFVYNRVSSKEIAGDLTSNVFYNALLKLKKFKFTGVSIRAWFFKIAYNEVLMHFRATGMRRHITLMNLRFVYCRRIPTSTWIIIFIR